MQVIDEPGRVRPGIEQLFGDRLLTVDGRWTDTLVDLFEAAVSIKAGQTAPLKVKRGDKDIELKVTPTTGL